MDEDGPAESVGRDSGLAVERTDLAWNRSGLAGAVTVAIVLRRLWPLHGDRTVLALALIAGGGALWVVGMRLGRRVGRAAGAERTLGESACRMMAAGTVLLAIAGFIVSAL
jgi:uncharacterized membrane protein YidH (DUF202 family)